MKNHFCIDCGSSIPFDGVNRPKFCPHCGKAQNLSAANAVARRPAPVYEPEDTYDEFDEPEDLEGLINALGFTAPVNRSVKLGSEFGSSPHEESFSRKKYNKADFKKFEKGIDQKTVIDID